MTTGSENEILLLKNGTWGDTHQLQKAFNHVPGNRADVSHLIDCPEKIFGKFDRRNPPITKRKHHFPCFQKKNERPMFRSLRFFFLVIPLQASFKHIDNSIIFIKKSRKISLDSGCEELYLITLMCICL